jgi:hypothetical protein
LQNILQFSGGQFGGGEARQFDFWHFVFRPPGYQYFHTCGCRQVHELSCENESIGEERNRLHNKEKELTSDLTKVKNSFLMGKL